MPSLTAATTLALGGPFERDDVVGDAAVEEKGVLAGVVLLVTVDAVLEEGGIFEDFFEATFPPLFPAG